MGKKCLLWALTLCLLSVAVLAGLTWEQVRRLRLQNALLTAIVNDRYDEARQLLRQGADANATNTIPNSWWGYRLLPARLVGHPAFDFDPREYSPLLLATTWFARSDETTLVAQRESLVRELLARGADPNKRNPEGRTPIFQALIYDQANVRDLLAAGADVNIHDNDGETPLHYATSVGATSAEMTRLILARHPDVNARERNGQTPLIQAVMNGETETVSLLLKNGDDVHLRDSFGKDALDYAKGWRRSDIVALLNKTYTKR